MKVKYMVWFRHDRIGGSLLGGCVALLSAVTLLLVLTQVVLAGGGKWNVFESNAVSFESIPGSKLKRVILTEKASERIGIETDTISEEWIERKQMVGGRVVPPVKIQPKSHVRNVGFGSFGRSATQLAPKQAEEPTRLPADGEAWVLVSLSRGEWRRLVKDAPARILPLATRDAFEEDILVEPCGMEPVEDMKRSMLKLYYKVPSEDKRLSLYERVRVELKILGSDEKRKVVPYSAVYYDATGTAWVYVNTKPLVFERKRIAIERVIGDMAVLTDCPPIGTKVASVGAALLYGAEVVFKK